MTSGEHEQRGADEAGVAGGANGPGPAGREPGGAAGGVPRAASRSGPRRGADDDLTGRVLGGRYRVTGRIGRGGMGVVCRADDQVLGREVALKVLRAYTDASAPELADLRTRMQREARAAARIRHSGVVTVHDVIEEDGRPVIVMELVDGPSLDDAVGDHGPMEPREIARVGAAVMDALAAAHQVGVLHRDVKPGNVLLDRTGRVVLTDFGIASVEAPGDGATTNITRSGELVGSLDYLPPERAQGMDPTPASDIWSLGMTLYAAVEGGTAPFRRTSVYSTLTAIVTEPLPEPRRAGPLTPVLHALMAKNPADRPSAAEARSMLRAVADGRDPGVTPPAPPSPAPSGLPYAPTATDVTAGAGPVPGPAGAGVAPVGWLGGPGAQGGVTPQPPAPYAPQGPAAHDPSATAAGSSMGATGPHPYPGGTDSDTARLPARRRRRVLLAVAAVVAVLAGGGGLTYALVGGGSGDRDTAAGRPPAAPAGSSAAGRPSVSAGKGGDGKALSPSPSGATTPAGDASASGSPKPGGPGGSPGGQTGGAAAGGGQGGADGGASGGGSHGGAAGGAHGGTTGGSGGGSGSGGTGGGSGGTGGGEPSQGPSCVDIGGGKANCTVWRTATSYTAAFQQVGHLNMGTNYFYCQAKLGRRETSGKWTNVWWAKTDDDSGNSGVYISVVYLTGGENDQPVPGLRVC
ncbi:serine/threonine-protein kinase [Streptomyces sp. MspMP-M5]|uniref:serine/threonine-protein kinase n=1 Tax=unclassified Streptomyces TaxID=2593676 RepID=UPI0003A689B8|nr:serine/threonine-protein kinase [Streptomyces sp. MspMP-M5]